MRSPSASGERNASVSGQLDCARASSAISWIRTADSALASRATPRWFFGEHRVRAESTIPNEPVDDRLQSRAEVICASLLLHVCDLERDIAVLPAEESKTDIEFREDHVVQR